ncbi:MAG TPA: ribbon-helix-helix domain-containing protein, partial [Pseudonocardiaceae bacterium]|nr:ribbon-helix-helix domain-containing protein [Pseudonocardiaceae bacterium]
MKVSVSLADDDVVFIDEYVRSHRARSRSAAIHEAVELLRSAQLADAYAAAWDEWEADGEADVWESAVGDGINGGAGGQS